MTALDQRLSAGAWATYQQSGRGILLLDLHDLAGGDIELHAVTEAMLPRLEVREHLFAEVRAVIAATIRPGRSSCWCGCRRRCSSPE